MTTSRHYDVVTRLARKTCKPKLFLSNLFSFNRQPLPEWKQYSLALYLPYTLAGGKARKMWS